MAKIEVKAMMTVPTLCDLFPSLMVKPDSWVTAQKKLSLACEIAIAPAPIAKTANTRIDSESSPKVPKMGAMMEAVVIIATVEDP